MKKALLKLLCKVFKIDIYKSTKFELEIKAPRKNPNAQRFRREKNNIPTVTNVIAKLLLNTFIISRLITFHPYIVFTLIFPLTLKKYPYKS